MSAAAPHSLRIQRLASDEEGQACARMMSASEPWITLGRGFEGCLGVLRDPAREVFVAQGDGRVLGFLILNMAGAFAGYIQTVCVAPDERSRGIGSRLVAFVGEGGFRG